MASDGGRLVLETPWRVFIVDVSSRRVLWKDDLLSPLTKSFARCTGQTAAVPSGPPVPAWPQCTATVLVTPDAKHVVQAVSNSQRRDSRGDVVLSEDIPTGIPWLDVIAVADGRRTRLGPIQNLQEPVRLADDGRIFVGTGTYERSFAMP